MNSVMCQYFRGGGRGVYHTLTKRYDEGFQKDINLLLL